MVIKINTRGLDKKTRRIIKEVMKSGNKSVHDVAEFGKEFAARKAPHFSEETARLIMIEKKITSKGARDTIVAKNILNDGHKRKYAQFDLVRWMHSTKGMLRGRKHIHSGDPQFMLATREVLNRVKGTLARGNFQRIRIN